MIKYKKAQQDEKVEKPFELAKTFYDFHKVLYDDITGKNYKPKLLANITGSDLQKFINSYWKELRAELIELLKQTPEDSRDKFSDYLANFVPYYEWRANSEKLTPYDLLREINKEKSRINNPLYSLKKLNLKNFNYKKLDQIVSNYFNKLDSLLEMNYAKKNNYNPESSDLRDNFTKQIEKAIGLYNSKLKFVKEMSVLANSPDLVNKNKILKEVYNNLSLIKQKGFDINNELPSLIKKLESI